MSCTRKGTLVFLLLGASVVFFITTIAIVPFLISTDAIRLRLARELSVWTGYDVQLRKPPRISIFPFFQVSLPEVLLTHTNNSSRIPLMDAQRIEVDISLYSALTGQVRFSETRIINPRFTIDEPKAQNGFPPFSPKASDSSQLPFHPFGRILIKGGMLSYPVSVSDNRQKDEISNINAVIDWPESIYSASLKASGSWHGALTNLTVNLDQTLSLMGGGSSPLRISVNSNHGGITFTGSISLSQNFLLNGRISSRLPSWNQSMSWIGADASKTFGANIAVPVVWESSMSIRPGHIELNGIVFTFGKDTARGALEIAFQDDILITTGSLAFKTLDLNQLIPILFPKNRETGDLSFLENVGLDVRLSIAKAVIKSISMNNIATSIQIRNGRLVFDIGNVQIFGGVAQTNIHLQRNNRLTTELQGRLSVNDLNLGLLSLGNKSSFMAKTNLTLSLKSTFLQWENFLYNAHSNLAFDLTAGAITGLDITDFIQKIRAAKTFPFAMTENKVFNFDKADGKITIESGQIKLEAVTIYFGDQYIDIRGRINYPERWIRLVGALNQPHLINEMCIDTQCIMSSLLCTSQFSIHGVLNQPIVSPVVQ